MFLLRQFLLELDDTFNTMFPYMFPLWCVYMVLTDSRSGSYDVTDDVITYNHCLEQSSCWAESSRNFSDCFKKQTENSSVWHHVAALAHLRHHFLVALRLANLRYINFINNNNNNIWFVYMVLTDSRSGSYDVTDDVITYNHCRNFGAKYLGNEAR